MLRGQVWPRRGVLRTAESFCTICPHPR